MKKVRCIAFFLATVCLLLSCFSSISYSEGTNSDYLDEAQYLALLSELVSATDFSKPHSSSDMNSILSNRLIVKTDSDLELLNDCGASAKIEGYNQLHILQYENSYETDLAYEYYSSQTNVEYVEQDFVCNFCFPGILGPGTLEDYSVISWGNEMVYTNTAFLLENFFVKSWENIVVAVLDTGLTANHTVFNNRLDSHSFNCINPADSAEDDDYRNSHGTFVAGIIADNTRSNVKIAPYKVLDSSGWGSYSEICSAIRMAVDNGADVINMSFGGTLDHSDYSYWTLKESIDYATDQNVITIAASGNSHVNTNNIYPINYNAVIGVSAVDRDGIPDPDANFGSAVDVSAPGVYIRSALQTGDEGINSGTSYAAPFVSAAAAILKTINPDITPSEAKERIRATATCPDGWDTNYGSGIVNFARMITNRRTGDLSVQLSNDGMVTMRSASPNAHIYFTTDGSDPEIGVSTLYTEPFRAPNAKVIKAIAYEEGALPTDVVSYRLQWSEVITVRYKGSKKVAFPTGYRIKRIYDGNNEIATLTFDGKISGVSVGETVAVAEFTNNCRITYHIHVEYAWWQQLIRYFLFGFLWY